MKSIEEFLTEENRKLRTAGCKLAEAALYVCREYDGIHRLLIEISNWSNVLANEGNRDKLYKNE